jgi:hypothetical protein
VRAWDLTTGIPVTEPFAVPDGVNALGMCPGTEVEIVVCFSHHVAVIAFHPPKG